MAGANVLLNIKRSIGKTMAIWVVKIVVFLVMCSVNLSAIAGGCRGYGGPGGACSAGPGGGLSAGPGGGLSAGPGGGMSAGPGGGLYAGPGGGMYAGPDGGLYQGPGGGLYSGPGGGIYGGPPSDDGYKGPWGPCITGAKDREWLLRNCPR